MNPDQRQHGAEGGAEPEVGSEGYLGDEQRPGAGRELRGAVDLLVPHRPPPRRGEVERASPSSAPVAGQFLTSVRGTRPPPAATSPRAAGHGSPYLVRREQLTPRPRRGALPGTVAASLARREEVRTAARFARCFSQGGSTYEPRGRRDDPGNPRGPRPRARAGRLPQQDLVRGRGP